MRATIVRRIAAVLGLTLVVLVGAALPAEAATLTNIAWSISKPNPGSTNVRYSWSFTTATAGTIASITFSVPAGTAGASLTVQDYYGVSVGTAALAGTTVTYTVTTPVAVASGVSVLISMDGFTNAAAGSYASTVTTRTNVPATIDTAGSNTVVIGNNQTTATVVVARTTSFSNDTTGFTMLMDPSLAALSDQTYPVHLTVSSNAASGYTLNIATNRQPTGTPATNTFVAVSSGAATGVASASFPLNRFGYTASATPAGGGALVGAGLLAGNYVGYTVAGENVFSSPGPTTGDALTITNRARIGYQQPADTYTATITYTVTPTY